MDIHGICPLLQVFDMPTAIRFYRDVLGFEVHVTSQPGDDCNWSWLKLNGAELMLNTAYEADQGRRRRIQRASRLTAIRACSSAARIHAAYRHLRAHGLNLKEPKVAPYGMKQLWFSDPDGYGLCFQYPASQETHDQWVADYGIEPKTFA